MEIKERKIKRFFHELSEAEQQIMLGRGEEIEVEDGKYLFSEGDFSKYLYLIRSGKIRLSKRTADGSEFSVHLRQKDELVGESSLFNETPINISAKVVESAILVRFDRERIEELFQENAAIAVAFMKWLTKYTQSTQAKFRDLMLFGNTGAFYSTLIRFSNSYGVKTEDGILINTELTNQEWANYIGTTRESVNRMLSELRKDDIISLVDGKILIHDICYLRDFLQCGDCPVEICTI